MTLNSIIANFQTFKLADLLDIVIIAFLIYQLGAWIYAEASFGIGQGVALLLLPGLIYLVAKKPYTASNDC